MSASTGGPTASHTLFRWPSRDLTSIEAGKKKARADIRVPATDPGADAWRNGKVIQIEDSTGRPHQH
jgi:hypothetical protein